MGCSGRARSAAPATTEANAATRTTERSPPGIASPKSSDPGRDRERVREQRRHAGRRERAAALEAELERREGEPVTCEQSGDEPEPRAAADRGLRPHVAGRVEHSRGDAEPGSRHEQPSLAESRRAGRPPPTPPSRHGHRDDAAVAGRRLAPASDSASSSEPGERDRDARPLARRSTRPRRARRAAPAARSRPRRPPGRARAARARAPRRRAPSRRSPSGTRRASAASGRARRASWRAGAARAAAAPRRRRAAPGSPSSAPPPSRARAGARGPRAPSRGRSRPLQGRYASAARAATPTRGRSRRRS